MSPEGKRVYTLKVLNDTASFHKDQFMPFTPNWITHNILTFCLLFSVLVISQKLTPAGTVTKSAHPARFSPDDKYSRHRVTLKKRFGLLLTQLPSKQL